MTLGILLATCPCAFSLNPLLGISQYAHKSWKNSEAFAKGAITSIAQTSDGYLWLGTEYGLFRFDGVRNVPWQPPPDQPLPSTNIIRLVATRDGTLWIGTRNGLASWNNGKLSRYAELAGLQVSGLLEDRQGTVWAGGWAIPTGRLCAIQKGSVRCSGDDGRFGNGVHSLYEHHGTLWAGASTGLWRWTPDPPKLYPVPGPLSEIRDLIEGDNGSLWIAVPGGIRQLVDGNLERYARQVGAEFNPARLLRDRDGGLWIGTTGQGLVHLYRGRTEAFVAADGLSGDNVGSLLEDKEGNIWVATNGGLDRFRDYAVPTISVKQGISSASVYSVLADRDGSIWVGASDGLQRWQDGQITIVRRRSARLQTRPAQQLVVRAINDDGLPDNTIESLWQDDRGRLWVSTPRGIAYIDAGRFVPVGGPSTIVHSIAEDKAGDLWINDQNLGLFHLQAGLAVEQISWAQLGRKDFAMVLAADPRQGGLWLGFFQGGVAYFRDGQVRTSYGKADGLGDGRVNDLRLDSDGTLWAGTERGLSRIKDRRIATLTNRNGLPCDGVQWSIEDDAQSVWLNMPCGLVRIARADLEAWVVDPNNTIKTAVFDSSDGVRSRVLAGGSTPHVAKAMDGKLWFVIDGGVSVVDPQHLLINKLPPPVHIEQITADHRTFDVTLDGGGPLRLPPLVRELQIDYTALSFVAPEKVRFKYLLEGYDSTWQDAGNRRQAFYTNLSARKYRFRVIASNNSGVWNESGDTLEFSVAPAYYQTTWFLALSVAVVLAILWGLHRLRVYQIAREFNAHLEGRVDERLRVARELHDTLLQSFQGLLLKLSSVTYLIRDRTDEAERTLQSVLKEAREAVTEGREAIQNMRSSTEITNDLSNAIGAAGDQLASEGVAEFRIVVEGSPRHVHPILRDEVFRIACEAIRNAFQHAQANVIEAEIAYNDSLRVRIRDDGKGIDPAVVKAGRSGHYGVPGMRERATQAGGKLNIWSGPGMGTEIELTIPGSIAYGTSPARTSMTLFRRRGKTKVAGHSGDPGNER